MLATLDKKLTKSILSLPSSWRPLMNAASFSGEPVIVLAIAAAAYISAALRDKSASQTALVYSAMAFAANILLKLAIHRARPNNLAIVTFGFKSYSFPSGHAFGTVIFYGLFAVLDIKYLDSPWNILTGSCIWAAIFLIGLSRVYLKKHYPTDVLAGWLLGGISLLIVCRLAL